MNHLPPPTVRLVDEHGAEARCVGGVWQVTEARTWWVEVEEDGPWSTQVEGRTLGWDPQRSAVAVALPFAVGRVRLTLTRGARQHDVELDVQPNEAKLGPDLWLALLDELETWMAGVTAGVEGPRQAGLDLDGLDLPTAVEATLPIVPAFERALRDILRDPKTRARTRLETQPVHLARRADRESIRWLSTHPEAAAWFLPGADPDTSGAPPELPVRTVHEVIDHPANRHLAWLTRAVSRRLEGAADALDHALKSELNDTVSWCEARVRALRATASRLRRLLRTSALATVPPEPATEAALLVLLDAPTYARAHRYGRQLLKLGFAPEVDHAVATRPSYHLYELWCLLAVQRAVDARVPSSWPRKWSRLNLLKDLGSTGSGASWVATSPDQAHQVGVWFNPRFPSRLDFAGEDVPTKRHALTGERRPDVAIGVQTGAVKRWLSLDAKYRVGRYSLGDAFTSAHLYRDALRWPRFDGPPAASVLLCPDATADTAPWYASWFHERHALGALVLRPGQARNPGFEAWLDTHLPPLPGGTTA
ncbi:MAG: DUF2357 domain-containing protein [Alphaproteobacteria bacterium]|nr:DUF2357 domain-containing protein [Alphaproteobacteria bacterium]